MKIFAKCLVIITVAAVLLAGYMVWSSDAWVTPEGYMVEAAADRADAYRGILSALREGADNLVAYEAVDRIGGADEYVFVTYTIRMQNADLVPMEWIDLEVENMPGDALLVKPAVQDIPALNQAVLSCTLMVSRANAPDYARQATLSYYIYGHYKEFPLTLK